MADKDESRLSYLYSNLNPSDRCLLTPPPFDGATPFADLVVRALLYF
ncbi:hypothetical protein LINGRAHAP2_LOCUS20409 [Linum grandiflorum]